MDKNGMMELASTECGGGGDALAALLYTLGLRVSMITAPPPVVEPSIPVSVFNTFRIEGYTEEFDEVIVMFFDPIKR